ncbi:hypothetical protein LRS74_06515 [Streptomyces sp. LX-29]|uniref:hypothetical protein n=1 Tax=Streptomyces sp. LX-29 TaxID=2900152 RepID=UPI00240E1594|nr:hypothetical protein [Streptomyces sp. LX-29]WFB06737.1 hypothetical protein LRS74_06515 [Streptomyces sp. LX-29]
MSDDGRRPGRRGALWGDPDFTKIRAGETVSPLGVRVTPLAVPSTAVLAVDVGSRRPVPPRFFESRPLVPLVSSFGVLVDRAGPRPPVIVVNASRAVPPLGAIGDLVGAGAATALAGRFPPVPLSLTAALVGVVPGLLVPTAGGSGGAEAAVFIGVLFATGAGAGVCVGLALSMRQMITPAGPLGRLDAGMRDTTLFGRGPIGGLPAGHLGAAIGSRPTLWVAGAMVTAAVIPLLPSPTLRRTTMPPAVDATPDDASETTVAS